ncbi:hypothetical protein [Donghicola sp. XS_ASV15]|uniref:hypothetical protein n=1 Tax=Donghicola sp. XS_ASV15 TaxID=3241295 RepID=UPI0035198979
MDPSKELDLLADLRALLDKAAFAPRSKLVAVLKNGEDALVAFGTFGDKLAIFKVYRTQDARELVQSASTALADYAARLGEHDDLGIVAALASAPELGLLIMEFAEGTQVSRTPERLDIDQTALMQRAARWLIACAGTDTIARAFAPNKALRKLEEPVAHLDPQQAPECIALFNSLKKQRPGLRGHPLIWGPTHGDFAPVNLMDDGKRMMAFDVQGLPRLPLLKPATNFLVARDLKRPVRDALRWGLDAQTTSDFFEAFGQHIPIDDNAIRFFVGHGMLRRLLFDNFKGNGRENAKVRVQNYLDEV